MVILTFGKESVQAFTIRMPPSSGKKGRPPDYSGGLLAG